MSVPIRFRKEGNTSFWKIGTNGDSIEFEHVKALLIEWGIFGSDYQRMVSDPILLNLDYPEQFTPAAVVVLNKQLHDFFSSKAWVIVIEDSRKGIVSLSAMNEPTTGKGQQ